MVNQDRLVKISDQVIHENLGEVELICIMVLIELETVIA